jgi:NADPH:quinone reductase-like Zn-dependent oxidoreductase
VSTGQTIAIVGAAGGVGSFAVQLAASVGARVIAATRAGNEDFVRGLGASEVVDSGGDLVGSIRELAPDGVDALIDTFHDAPGLVALAPVVRRNGWIVSPRAQGIDEALTGLPVQGALVSAALGRVGEIAELVASGTIRVPLELVPLEDANRALAAIGGAAVRGKQVVTIG